MTGVPFPSPLFAVHLSDGVLTVGWLAGGWGLLALLLLSACWKLTEETIPRVGLMTAALFVASQLHLPVGVGSVHLLLNGLAGVLLGRHAPLAIAVAVGLQSLLFAHGGLTTIGVNADVMAVPAAAAGWLFGGLRRLRVRPLDAGFVVGAVTSFATIGLNAAVLALGGAEDWNVLVAALFVAHLPVVGVEALGTAFVAEYLAKVKPEWLAGHSSGVTSANGTSH